MNPNKPNALVFWVLSLVIVAGAPYAVADDEVNPYESPRTVEPSPEERLLLSLEHLSEIPITPVEAYTSAEAILGTEVSRPRTLPLEHSETVLFPSAVETSHELCAGERCKVIEGILSRPDSVRRIRRLSPPIRTAVLALAEFETLQRLRTQLTPTELGESWNENISMAIGLRAVCILLTPWQSVRILRSFVPPAVGVSLVWTLLHFEKIGAGSLPRPVTLLLLAAATGGAVAAGVANVVADLYAHRLVTAVRKDARDRLEAELKSAEENGLGTLDSLRSWKNVLETNLRSCPALVEGIADPFLLGS